MDGSVYNVSVYAFLLYSGNSRGLCTDSVGSGAASNLSSPGVMQQQRVSLVESVTGDMSTVSITQSGLCVSVILII